MQAPEFPLEFWNGDIKWLISTPQDKHYCLQFSNKEPEALRDELIGAPLTLLQAPLLTNPHPAFYHRFPLSPLQYLSHIAKIPFHLWCIYTILPALRPKSTAMNRTGDFAPTLRSPPSFSNTSCSHSLFAEGQLWKLHRFPYFISSVWLCLAFKVFHDLDSPRFHSPPVPQELVHLQPPSRRLSRSSSQVEFPFSSAKGSLTLSCIYKLTRNDLPCWRVH